MHNRHDQRSEAALQYEDRLGKIVLYLEKEMTMSEIHSDRGL